jgi:hypothetical protein
MCMKVGDIAVAWSVFAVNLAMGKLTPKAARASFQSICSVNTLSPETSTPPSIPPF